MNSEEYLNFVLLVHLLLWYNLSYTMPRLLIGNTAVYPRLVDFTGKFNFSL